VVRQNVIEDRINYKEELLEIIIMAMITIDKLQGSIRADTVY